MKYIEKTNLGVKPLGRGEVPSEVIVREVVALKRYGRMLRESSPVNCEGRAKSHRVAYLNYIFDMAMAQGKKGRNVANAKVKNAKALYDSLGLDY